MDKTELRKDIKIKSPTLHDSVFVADGARVIGDVTLKRGSSIWYNTVARADINKIIIGERSNVQDNSVIHLELDSAIHCEKVKNFPTFAKSSFKSQFSAVYRRKPMSSRKESREFFIVAKEYRV